MVKQQQMFLMLQDGSDTVVAMNEMHVIINSSIYLPLLQLLCWTTGQSEAVPCAAKSQATAPCLPAHLLFLGVIWHHFGEIQACIYAHIAYSIEPLLVLIALYSH